MPACSLEEIDKEEIPRESSSNFRSYSKLYSKFGFTIHNIALIVMRSLQSLTMVMHGARLPGGGGGLPYETDEDARRKF